MDYDNFFFFFFLAQTFNEHLKPNPETQNLSVFPIDFTRVWIHPTVLTYFHFFLP